MLLVGLSVKMVSANKRRLYVNIKMLKKSKGFNLVELMVSMSIMCFLFVLSAPTYSAWMANMRVRNIAESINFGIMQARAEAVRRNKPVSFSINADTSWTVNVVETNQLINQKNAQESSDTTTVALSPAGADTITFDGYGFITANVDASPTITSVNVNSTKTFDGIKSLRVKVGGGGTVFVCDPNVATTSDPRYCRSV